MVDPFLHPMTRIREELLLRSICRTRSTEDRLDLARLAELFRWEAGAMSVDPGQCEDLTNTDNHHL